MIAGAVVVLLLGIGQKPLMSVWQQEGTKIGDADGALGEA